MKKLIIAAALVAAMPAQATLIVSGDSNIITTLNDNYTSHDVNNQRFFTNILNGSSTVVIRDSQAAGSLDSSYLTSFYTGLGISSTVANATSAITATDLGSTGLYIDVLPAQGYSTGEVTAIAAFINGGGNFLVSGDNYFFPEGIAGNGYINALLGSLGSSIQITDACLACGYFDFVPTVGSGYLVAGVPGIQFAAGSYLTGGLPLFSYSNKIIVATDTIAVVTHGVPEPASWAMLIAGFGLTGAAMRRRRLAVAA